MSDAFLEFWKNTFSNAAEGIRQFQTLARWMDQGMKGFQEISDQFEKAYGHDRFPETSKGAGDRWDRTVRDFQASYQKWMDGMGLVPKSKYMELLNKCKKQERVISEQKEALSLLRSQKVMEKAGQEMVGFVQLMEKQAAQFRRTMEAMGSFMGQGKIQKKE